MRQIRFVLASSLLFLLAACAGSGTTDVGAPAKQPSQAPESLASATAQRAEPAGRIAFAADGSIYVVNADGSGLTKLVDGDNAAQEGIEMRIRQPRWASGPAFSPDGRRVAFVRDLDVWVVNADGTDERLLGDVTEFNPSPGASNWTFATANVSWSPDGTRVAYSLVRGNGSGLSGLGVLDVATGESYRLHGRYPDSGMFMTTTWLPDDSLVLSPTTGMAARFDAATGDELPPVELGKPSPWPALLEETNDGRWLAGSFITEGAIVYGPAGALTHIANGVSPTLSPDKGWVAYYKGDTIRLVQTDGLGDHELIDLASLGGRDRLYGSMPDCYTDHSDNCSYRPPMLSWAAP